MILTSYFKNTKLYIVISSLLFFSNVSGNSTPISIKIKNEPIEKTIQTLITEHQIPIIYPSEIIQQNTSMECNECNVESILEIILANTDYGWEKIGDQYTIFEITRIEFSLTGKVHDKNSNETIPYANIYIPSLDIGTISDDEGVYSLSKIDTKICTLFVSYIGYETQKTIITHPKTNKYSKDIYLNQKIINSKNIYIKGNSREFLSIANEPGKISFSPKHISTLPTIGEVDVFRSLQLLPGISSGLGGNAELYIRGSRPDQNLIMIDGIPLYQETHMFGFLSSTQAASIKDIQVFKGVYPARYGGKISGLIEITNKTGTPSKAKAKIFTNLTTNSAQLELPMSKKGSLILTGRVCNDIVPTRLYSSIKDFIIGDDNFNLISLSADEGQNVNYNPRFNFKDINAVASYILNSKNRISFTLKHGEDNIDEEREFFGFENILSYDSTKIIENTTLANTSGILKWALYLNPEWSTKLSLAKTKYGSDHNSILINNSLTLNEYEQSVYEENIFTDEILTIYQNIKSIKNHHLQLGYSHSTFNSDFNTQRILNESSEETRLVQKASLRSIFLEDKWAISKNIKLRLGIRNTYFSKNNSSYLEPRISATMKVTPNFIFEGALGKNNQFIHQFNSPLSTRGTQGTWLISQEQIPVVSSFSSQISSHWKGHKHEYSISLYQRSSEGHFNFEKYLSPIPILSEQNEYGNQYYTESQGKEKINGAEVLIRRKNSLINGWISYHFNETKYSFPDINDGNLYKADHDLRHEFKSVLITSILNWDVTTSWSYSSGRVFTHENDIDKTNDFQIIFDLDSRNKQRLPSIHHLDLSISKIYKLKKFEINTGLSIYNIYNRKNISHKRYNPYTSGKILSDVIMLGTTPTIFIEVKI